MWLNTDLAGFQENNWCNFLREIFHRCETYICFLCFCYFFWHFGDFGRFLFQMIFVSQRGDWNCKDAL